MTLAVNIGTADKARLNLDRAAEGETVDVEPPVADYLLKRGWATAAKVEPPKAEPPKAARIEGAPAGAKNANA